ncbi:MAG TPA: metallophosphoesterase [Kofleriaceae bacterium]|nr:metallophosphoesterase [Kofleriaceae bacterium]
MTQQIASGELGHPVLLAGSVAVISDLHLGSGTCVLDEGHHLERLGEFLAAHDVNVDAFVLNGDLCDFSMATMRETLTSARRFLRVIAPRCAEMVYLPGNHDHHSWLLANEVHELLFHIPDVAEDCVQRTERMYRSTSLARLAGDPGRDLMVAYPNLYWRPPGLSQTTYLFHHGHFCEDLYTIVSDTLTTAFPDEQRQDLEFLEAANFGWLELIWYHLGQGGKGIGANGLVERLYEQVSAQGPEVLAEGIQRLYRARLQPIVHRVLKHEADARWWLTEGMAERVASWLDEHASRVVISLISAYAKQKQETLQPAASRWRFRELDADLAQHCLAYIQRSVAGSKFLPADDRVAFFFGHTHVAGMWCQPGQPALFNDGGWTRGPDGAWPEAHVFKIDGDGAVTDLYFGERDADCTVTSIAPFA